MGSGPTYRMDRHDQRSVLSRTKLSEGGLRLTWACAFLAPTIFDNTWFEKMKYRVKFLSLAAELVERGSLAKYRGETFNVLSPIASIASPPRWISNPACVFWTLSVVWAARM